MDALLKDVKAQHGRLDALVANAVVDDHAPLGRITEEQFDTMIGTNLKGVLFAVQSAVSLMARGGSIILIGSTASVAPPSGMSIYGAIKAGFHGMVRALIQDLKGTGVRINILSPGAVDTPSLRRALGKAAGPDGWTRSYSPWRSAVRWGGSETRGRSERSRCSSPVTRRATSMAWNCLSTAG